MNPLALEEIPQAGRLADFELPRLLLALHRQRFQGVLELSHERSRKRFCFQQGSPVSAESNLSSEALGAQLVSEGLLSDAARERVTQCMKERQCREGVALLALQLISPKDLFRSLKEQVRRRLIDAFAWPDGGWQLLDEEPESDAAQAFRSDPIALVHDGIRAHWGIDRVLEALAERANLFVAPGPGFAKLLRRLRLEPDSEALFAALDGSTQLAQTLSAVMGSARDLAALWVLDAIQALHYSETPRAESGVGRDAEFESEIEIAISREPASERESASRSASARGPTGVDSSDDEKREAIRTEIEARVEDLARCDHYQLLGVDSSASEASIKKAYFKLAKRYHPDSLARMGLEDLKQDAASVFARIAEAFETLQDPGKRSEYDAALGGEDGGFDANRLAQAEAAYRKGEVLIRMGDFQGALDFLQPAVELWPEECAYQSTLGWALYKKSPSDPEAARTHLEIAVGLGPADATAHFRLGIVLRSLGDEAGAERLLALAKRLDPAAAG